jgi:putative tryptophan/tyrosine transport system substrate-binding protein
MKTRPAILAIFAAVVALSAMSPAQTQQSALPVIGILSSAAPVMKNGAQFAALYAGLKEGGYIEGQNVTIEYRWANDHHERLAGLARGLVEKRVAVIIAAGGHVSALTAHEATKDIPIVFPTVTDPVKLKLVASLNRPGGNSTGTAGLTAELDEKRLEILKDLKPEAKSIGVLADAKRPSVDRQLKELESAAKKMGISLKIETASGPDDIERAVTTLAEDNVEALLVTADPLFNSKRSEVVALASRYRLPAIYQWREFVAEGGLVSYGPSITEAYHQAGLDAARILKGEKPADIPVVQPATFELVINRRTAKQLGLSLPASLIARADKVID